MSFKTERGTRCNIVLSLRIFLIQVVLSDLKQQSVPSISIPQQIAPVTENQGTAEPPKAASGPAQNVPVSTETTQPSQNQSNHSETLKQVSTPKTPAKPATPATPSEKQPSLESSLKVEDTKSGSVKSRAALWESVRYF
jgi:hypothetical protein